MNKICSVKRSLTLICFFFYISTNMVWADRMYWTEAGSHRIRSANLDGTDIRDLVTTGVVNPHGIALDLNNNKMYWAEADGQKIRRANLDGTEVETILTSVSPVGIALDLKQSKMYWTDVFIDGKIYRSNLDGSDMEVIIGTVADREGLALDVDGGKMYWTDRSLQRIQRANLDGTQEETVITFPDDIFKSDPRGIALDLVEGKIYWAEALSHKIRRANLDGSNIEDLVTTGLVNPAGIVLDLANGKVYWTDFGTHKIYRANLDGTDVKVLISSGLSYPVGIALFASAVVITPLTISPPSGTYVTTQEFDLVIILRAPELNVIKSRGIFNGADITEALAGCIKPGTLLSNGQTFRCPNLRGSFWGSGNHTFSMSIDLSDGSTISDSVMWKVLTNSEP